MLPARIGGPKMMGKKPTLVVSVGVGKKIPSRIGGPQTEEEEPETESEPYDNEAAKDAAVSELFSAIENGSTKQGKAALEAFFYACGDDMNSETEGESSEEEA